MSVLAGTARQTTGHPVTFEFWKNNKYLFSIGMSLILMGYTYTKKFFVVFLKLKFNWNIDHSPLPLKFVSLALKSPQFTENKSSTQGWWRDLAEVTHPESGRSLGSSQDPWPPGQDVCLHNCIDEKADIWPEICCPHNHCPGERELIHWIY